MIFEIIKWYSIIMICLGTISILIKAIIKKDYESLLTFILEIPIVIYILSK